ncbi:hypothetical protein RQN9TF_20975 [Rhodococcus qingshengii]|nr:hypothetical protein [Rhodococcus sp. PvP104]BDQ21686.1 hypothetical protein RQN9TF_20975 [Rhodococcus qingshengii]
MSAIGNFIALRWASRKLTYDYAAAAAQFDQVSL